MESIFDAQKWVKKAVSWYLWGEKDSATYQQVSTGNTKHREGIEVTYDPSKISYRELVELYWQQIDPTDSDGQFADTGPQYTTAIYYKTPEEQSIVEQTQKFLEDSKKFEKPIVTKIIPFTTFFPAEEYHQDYAQKNALRYSLYAKGSGREDFKESTWKDFQFQNPKAWYQEYSPWAVSSGSWKHIVLFFHAPWCSTCQAIEKNLLSSQIPDHLLILKVDFDTASDLRKKYQVLTQSSFVEIDSQGNILGKWVWWVNLEDIQKHLSKVQTVKKTYTDAELRAKLTPEQYKVLIDWGTEPPFDNAYWDNHDDGIYVDVLDGTPLFSSTDKFDSGTGWPSFTRPIEDNFITTDEDDSLGMIRTEVSSKTWHLGHVFDDGPTNAWGKRYCINSAVLRFVPKAQLEKEWYGKYLVLFDQ